METTETELYTARENVARAREELRRCEGALRGLLLRPRSSGNVPARVVALLGDVGSLHSEEVAEAVCARRSTVAVALTRLRKAGQVEPTPPHGHWKLTEAARRYVAPGTPTRVTVTLADRIFEHMAPGGEYRRDALALHFRASNSRTSSALAVLRDAGKARTVARGVWTLSVDEARRRIEASTGESLP